MEVRAEENIGLDQRRLDAAALGHAEVPRLRRLAVTLLLAPALEDRLIVAACGAAPPDFLGGQTRGICVLQWIVQGVEEQVAL